MRAVAYSRDAARTLRRMPANVAVTIRGKIEQYAAAPETLANNVKSLKGMPGILRLRVGDWRVIFTETLEVVAIEKIAPRGGAYE
jgi:mRNA interferase RelE/StbE